MTALRGRSSAMNTDLLIPGTEVTLRGMRWQVVRTEDYESGRRLRLRGLGAAVLGEEIDILPEIENVTAIRHDVDPERAGRLRDWLLYHQAFVLEQSLGPNALLAVQPGRLELQPYQLVPVVRAIEMSRVRLLLADGVGLGKTIQAGLVLAELMARRLAQRVLIVSPAGPLLDQWRTEMQDRFGLRLLEIDRASTERIRKQVELGANPFDHAHLAIASIDYLKQERVLGELERTSYDVVIIDEAHHCVDLGGAGASDDSLRRRLADVLAGRCDTLLLLTATPHDGFDRSFASLCELLDPSLVDGRGALRGDRYRQYVIRRLKRHIRDPRTNERVFPERQVVPHRIVVDIDERPRFVELSRSLLELVAPELRRAIRAKRYDDVLSFFALLKRSVSTVAACRGTLQVVLDRFREAVGTREESHEARRERLRTLRDARRRLDRFGVATAEEEADIQEMELEDIAQQLAGLEREARSERRRIAHQRGIAESLEHLVELASAAEPEDPKIDAVAAQIGAIRAEEPVANVLIYTEYTTSQDVVVQRLRDEGYEVLTLRGGGDMGAKERKEATQRFSTQDGLVMVCTDAAAEGLNLHYKCHHLIHLELPFNPNRLEQRNGRIDRYGQKKNPVVRYLHLAGTFEENILLRLIAKYERQRAKLTYVPNTLGLTASPEERSRRLLQGIIDTEDTLFADQAPSFTLLDGDPADGAEDAVRELLDEIDRSFGAFEKAARTNDWLADAGLNADIETARRAGEMRSEGDRTALIDLPPFVVDAVLRDGGRIEGRVTDDVFEIHLPGTIARREKNGDVVTLFTPDAIEIKLNS
ncbi:MAG: DEAD/DEAH box helicase [Planctomycetota bacterium]|nr:MAG: DEAD/DEAH box helicase [Planctomycetota bacterium]